MLYYVSNSNMQSSRLERSSAQLRTISMLVYMYSHLRETCLMGHTHVKMKDIDVNSHQSQYFNGTNNKYLSFAKTAGSIVRVVVDELACTHDDEEENDLIGKENKEYEKR